MSTYDTSITWESRCESSICLISLLPRLPASMILSWYIMTHPRVWKRSSWDLLFRRCLLRVKLAQSFNLTCVHTSHSTETRYGTFHSCRRCVYLMVVGSVQDGHKDGTEYCPIPTATSTCYWQGDGFRDGSKNSRSFKSVLVWDLHQNPISPNETPTHPGKPEYSATLPREPKILWQKKWLHIGTLTHINSWRL